MNSPAKADGAPPRTNKIAALWLLSSGRLAGWSRATVSTAVPWFRHSGLFLAALAVPLALIYGSALTAHVRRCLNPYVFNDDVRIWIFPFFRYYDSELFSADYLGSYLLKCCLPAGYRAFYWFGALFWDPAAISKVLPYVLLLSTVTAIAVAARRLSGYFGAFFATALVLSNPLFLDRMAGGLQRAFGFPVLAVLAVALVHGKPRLAAIAVCLGAVFYPPSAVVGGITLVCWLLLLPSRDRGAAADWMLPRRIRLLAVTAGICVLVVLPNFLGARSYGRALGPRDVAEYPEVGVAGRFVPSDRAPFDSFPKAALEQAQAFFHPVGQPYSKQLQHWLDVDKVRSGNARRTIIVELVTGGICVGTLLLVAQSADCRRLFTLGAAAWVAHLLARLFAPQLFMPDRYVTFPIPIILVLLVPAAGAAIGKQIGSARLADLARQLGVVAMACVTLFAFAGRGSSKVGLNIDVTSNHLLYDFVGRLPKDVLVAGWPDDMNNVPYVSRRQAFLTWEVHLPHHKKYADETRRRMRALISAYFATDAAPLRRLRDEFGVTHLLFNPRVLQKPPAYFEPFSGAILEAFSQGQENGFEIPRQLNATVIFSDGKFFVLDLHRLNETL